MCYPKPGPRCSGHATKRLDRARARLAKDPDNPALILAVKRAYDEYLHTPAGIRELEASPGRKSQELAAHYRARRKAMINSYKAWKAGDVTQRVEDFILRTAHGSKLYGLDHAGSDDDWYVVVPEGRKRATQKIVGKSDVLVITLSEFTQQIHKGVPQALEALFSPLGERLPLDAYRENFYPDTAKVAEVYRRTIKHFMLGDAKRRRHALRLSANLTELFERGQFNPRLTPEQRDEFTRLANSSPEEYFEEMEKQCPVVMFSDDESREAALKEIREKWDPEDKAL